MSKCFQPGICVLTQEIPWGHGWVAWESIDWILLITAYVRFHEKAHFGVFRANEFYVFGGLGIST